MRKLILLLMLVGMYTTNVMSQREVCETPEDNLDLNSITKCTIEQKDKKRQNNSTNFC